MIGDRGGGGEEAIQGAGEEDTMADGEDLGEGGGAEAALQTTMAEVTVRAVVVGQVLGAVLGTTLWVSLAEGVTVEVVGAVAEGLEETWVVLEVVTEALEVDLEVAEVGGEVDEDWGASRWIPTPSEELRAPSTLTKLRRIKAQLKRHRWEDHRLQTWPHPLT